ncbi:hypothetical protein ABGT22_25390 [Peribacillus frigoritolerans]|uniref:hypothetical protein n=1 Tax=Peribacillus frigoritolerans TaxID=450367 RepID=UPI00345C7379
MDNINKSTVLARAFNKLSKNELIEFMKDKKVGWVLDKKKKRKMDLKNEFLNLESVLTYEEIVELAEMTVMRKTKGLPAYTYKLRNLGKIDGMELKEIKEKYKRNFPLDNIYEINIIDVISNGDILEFLIKVKEFDAQWKNNIRDLGTLTAVYLNKVSINKTTSMISIEVGADNIAEVIVMFFSSRLGIGMEPYTIGTFNATTSERDSATEKTMLIFDFIYNRLPSRGISSNFNDMRFYISNTANSDGVSGVTIHGDDIITSDLACKYITLGNDIISFKATSVYDGEKVNINFNLKGKNHDKLKVVIMDNKSESFKLKVMEKIQLEYVLMCTHGIMDIGKTRTRLDPIYEKFVKNNS